jgi:DNA-directed RNA polymerase subunit RPC12/RpoP
MQNNPQIEKENINRFLCPNCAANMSFDAAIGKLLCPYCGYAKEIESSLNVEEKSYEAFLRPDANQLQPMARDAMQVNCSTCGAIVQFTPPDTATECAFCGGKIVAQPKSADPLIAPEGVLPFKVTQKEADSALKIWLASRWFAPSKLKEFARPDKLSSVYIPYWTYDADSYSTYAGERGEYYYETQSYTENGERKTRQVRKTRWYSASGAVDVRFDDVCVPATQSLSEKHLNELEPWDLEALKTYEPAYLSGHKAQTYQISLPQGFEAFKGIAGSQINYAVRRDIGGDEQRVHNVSTNFSAITFKHILLPVYAGAYNFNSKIFQIVINARTAEVQGERPYSWIKILLFVLFIIIIILILAALFAK